MSQSAPPVVTIFEQYGAGADQIGPALAKRLGVQYLGQAYTSEQFEAMHQVPVAEQSAFDRFMISAGRGAEPGESTPVAVWQMADNDAVNNNNAELNSKAVEGLVVLGRTATVVVQTPALHVKLVADQAARIKHAVDAYKIDEDVARRRQAWEDEDRAQMAIHFYGWDPRGTDGYDLIVDTGKGYDAALDEIEAAAKKKLGL